MGPQYTIFRSGAPPAKTTVESATEPTGVRAIIIGKSLPLYSFIKAKEVINCGENY